MTVSNKLRELVANKITFTDLQKAVQKKDVKSIRHLVSHFQAVDLAN